MNERLQQLSEKMDERLQQFEAVDLADEPSSYPEPSRRYYPTLYISGRKNPKIHKLPASGKAVVRYRVKSRSENTHREGEKPSYSSDIEIRSIEPVKGKGKPVNLQEVIERNLSQDFADRARDSGGRYSQGDAPPSAEDFATVKKKKKRVLAGAGAAALVAGGALPMTRRGASRIGQAAGRLLGN
jgi:hypothetical protein